MVKSDTEGIYTFHMISQFSRELSYCHLVDTNKSIKVQTEYSFQNQTQKTYKYLSTHSETLIVKAVTRSFTWVKVNNTRMWKYFQQSVPNGSK